MRGVQGDDLVSHEHFSVLQRAIQGDLADLQIVVFDVADRTFHQDALRVLDGISLDFESGIHVDVSDWIDDFKQEFWTVLLLWSRSDFVLRFV